MGKYGECYARQCRERKEPVESAQEECAAIGHEFLNGKCRFCGYRPPEPASGDANG